MSMLKFTSFGGEIPRLTKRDLPNNNGQICEHLFPDTPEFRPINTDAIGTAIGYMAPNAICRTLYRYPTNSTESIGSEFRLSLVRSPIVGDTLDRVYTSSMCGDPENQPAVLSYDGVTNGLRVLGVKRPTIAPTLAQATVDDAFLTPGEITDYKESLMQRIKTIVAGGLQRYPWNPSFNLTGNPAFRADPNLPADQGIYQRMYVLTNPGNPTPVWSTLNGTPVENHLWATQVTNPPFLDEGPNRVYYASFQAGVWVWKVNSNVTAQTNALKALVVPGTTDRVLTDEEIDLLWASLRSVLPDDPLTTANTDLKTLLNKYQTEYVKLVNYLDQGFSLDVSPQAAYQLVAESSGQLQSAANGISAIYGSMATTDFDAAVIGYFREVRFSGKLPDGEAVIADPRFYTYSFVNDRGEESALFSPEAGTDYPFIECTQATTATITLPAGAISGLSPTDYITKWRVYRSVYSGADTKFQFVSEVPIGITSYTDLRRADGLGEVAENLTWYPPPTSGTGPSTKYLRHMVSMPGGFMAGFLGDTIYFSVPYHPYAWPPEYSVPCESDVLALGVFGVTLVVLTKRGPIYMSGNSPDSISTVYLESNEVCQSPKSVVPVSGGVLFASQNGLCLASQQGVKCLTESLWTKHEWRSLVPSEFICEEHNGNVFMAHTGGLVVGMLHIPTMKLVRMSEDFQVTAFYSDFYTGELFAALQPEADQAPKFVKVTDGEELRTARWRSKRIVLEKETSFAWIRVEGEQSAAAPLRVKLYGYQIDETGAEVENMLNTATGDATYSAIITNTDPVRVGVGRYKDYEVEISGQCRISSLQLYSSTIELQKVS